MKITIKAYKCKYNISCITQCTAWVNYLEEEIACSTKGFKIPKNIKEIYFVVSTEEIKGAEFSSTERATNYFLEKLKPYQGPLWWWIEY